MMVIVVMMMMITTKTTYNQIYLFSSVSIKLKSSLAGRQKLCMKWAQWPLGCTQRLILMNCDTPNGRLCASVSFDCKFRTPCILVAFWTACFFPMAFCFANFVYLFIYLLFTYLLFHCVTYLSVLNVSFGKWFKNNLSDRVTTRSFSVATLDECYSPQTFTKIKTLPVF